MDFMTALDVAASGLTAERRHLNVISMNLANINTTRVPGGGPYRRKTVVMETQDVLSPFSRQMQDANTRELKGVKVAAVVGDKRQPRSVYDPGHPDADQSGYVKYPDINVVEEMAHMVETMRSYESGTATIETIKSMYGKALSIGQAG